MSKIVQKHTKDILEVVLGALAGFSLFWLTSHPHKSPVRKKLPQKRIRNISVLPEIKLHTQKRIFHFHHWFNLSVLYIILLLTKRLHKIRSRKVHGFLVGSILQGLMYKDRFHLIHPSPIKEE